MKKIISKTLVLLVSIIYCLIPLSPNLVKAATSTNTSNEPNIVYYQSIVQSSLSNSGGFSSINVVSQYHYKSTSSLDSINNKNVNTFTSLTNSSICGLSTFSSYASGLCNNDSTLKGALATLKIDNYGNITMTLGNDVELTNLRIYYIIANRSNETRLFCDDNNICPNAKNITKTDGTSNWKNFSKTGNMVYTQSTIGDSFTSSTTSSGTNYSGFNIFSNMSSTWRDYASGPGVYVVTSFSISYNGKNYYANNYTIDSKTFNNIGSTSSNAAETQAYLTCTKATEYSCEDNIDSVTKAAALVKMDETSTTTSNVGVSAAWTFYDTYVKTIVVIVVGVMFVVTGTSTIVTIVKSSDEPEVRSSEIKRLIGLFTGAVTIALILYFAKDIVIAISGLFG
jgi:hypothetical protein